MAAASPEKVKEQIKPEEADKQVRCCCCCSQGLAAASLAGSTSSTDQQQQYVVRLHAC
jgi:hypothetical protein